MAPDSVPTLAWLQLALEEQDAVAVKTQVNVAAGRVDVVVGQGLRAAVQPDADAGSVVLHGALSIHSVATEPQKDDLLARLGSSGAEIEFAVVDSEWLAFRRALPAGSVDDPEALGRALRAFLVESLDALKTADEAGIL